MQQGQGLNALNLRKKPWSKELRPEVQINSLNLQTAVSSVVSISIQLSETSFVGLVLTREQMGRRAHPMECPEGVGPGAFTHPCLGLLWAAHHM